MLTRRRPIGSRYDAARLCALVGAAVEVRQSACAEQCENSATRHTIDGNQLPFPQCTGRYARRPAHALIRGRLGRVSYPRQCPRGHCLEGQLGCPKGQL